MPFDPALPEENAPLISQVLREQFNGLKALIDAILALDAQVDGVNTVPAGDPANATVSVTGTTLHFTFDLSRGDTGVSGGEGPVGPPFAQAVVDGVNTLDPGSPATVEVTFDGTNVHFTFALPRGQDGETGPQGPPGEVTTAQLESAIATTALNPLDVSPMSVLFSDPPTAGEMEQVQDKVNELLAATTRIP